MKISVRPLKLLLPLLLVFFTESGFNEFFFTSPDDPLLIQYNLAVLVLSLGVAGWYWRRMEPVVRWGMLLTVVYLLALLLEAYSMGAVYIHVFSKVLVLFVLYAAYGFYYQRGLPPMKLVAGVMLIVLILNLFIEHPEAVSVRAFLEHDRGFSATAALMLVLPTVLCLNWYLQRGNLLVLAFFFIGLAMIVFLQHRSVWITTLIALPVNLLLLAWRVPSVRFSLQRVLLLVLLPVVVGIVGGLATVLGNPEVMKKFENNYEDITQAETQGTGNWRLQQMQAYQPVIAARPLAGWRLQGFELPVQFYDPSSDQPMWPNGTGHHFHSFYLDRLFYFGWLGLLLVVMLPCVQVIKRLGHRAPLSVEAPALIGLLVGCLVFGLSYDWPAYLYALLGLLLVATAQPGPAPVAAPLVPAPEPAAEPVLFT